MATTLFRHGRRVMTLALLLPVVLASGCLPAGWLPDSSGFVYTRSKDFNRLYFYDVARGESKVLVEDLGAMTPWPAVAPDGKRVAVALLAPPESGKQLELEVILYNLQGKEAHRSPKFLWRKLDGASGRIATGLFWSPTRDKLLVHGFEDESSTGIYDLASKKLIKVNGSPCAFAGTPLRPDDKGFLVVREGKDLDPELALVDWAGNERAIQLKLKDLDPEDVYELLKSPWTGTSKWNGSTAEVTNNNLRIIVDTEKRIAAVEPFRPAAGQEGVVQRYDFPRGRASVRVMETTENETTFHELQLFKPGQKKPDVLFTLKNGRYVLSPSPDGKWLVARALGDNCKELDFILVSSEGKVREVARKK